MQMMGRGLEILPQGQDVTAGAAQIRQGLEEFSLGFSQAQHEPRLGVEALSTAGFGFAQYAQGFIISRPGTDLRSEPPHGFQIVIKDIRGCIQHGVDSCIVIVKIGRQYFNDGIGIEVRGSPQRFAEMFGPTILQSSRATAVITTCLTASVWSPPPHEQARRPPGAGVSPWPRHKSRKPGCNVAGDHKCRRAFAPTLPMIRTTGALSHTVCNFNSSRSARVWLKVSVVGKRIRSHSGKRARVDFTSLRFRRAFSFPIGSKILQVAPAQNPLILPHLHQ